MWEVGVIVKGVGVAKAGGVVKGMRICKLWAFGCVGVATKEGVAIQIDWHVGAWP